MSDRGAHVERKRSTKEGGAVAKRHPVHVGLWECIGAGGWLHSAPATTLRQQSQHLKLCMVAEQVKEKQVKVSFRS